MNFAKNVQELFHKDKQAWLDDCRTEAKRLLVHRPFVTIEDITVKCPRPKHIKPNVTGSVFLHPDFQKVGAPVRAKHREANGHWISRWTLSRRYKRLNKHANEYVKGVMTGYLEDE